MRSFVVAARVALLLLVSGGLIAGVLIGLRDRSNLSATQRYVCPMHPDVRSIEPGMCPICGMALEPVSRQVVTGAGARAVDLAAVENIRRHNIVDFVRKRSLLPNQRELRGAAWVDDDGRIAAVLYRDQIDALDVAEPGSFVLTQAPSVTFPVHRSAGAASQWDPSTSLLYFSPDLRDVAGHSLRPGLVGWLELSPRPRQVLTVPVSAILPSASGPYVLVPFGFELERRPIEIGETFLKDGFAIVLSGLSVNERVIAKASFFIDADRRLGKQAWGGS